MKRLSTAMFMLTLCAAASTAIIFAGCESTDAGGIDVSPTYVELRVGQSATFHATGAQYFTWSLSKREIGSLSSSRGEYVVYTARSGSGDPQVITVKSASSTNAVVSASSTSAVVSAYSATATVKHL